jgi:general secretion pathway protein G
MRKAFTMVELVFVIVVIGILAGVAVPKFAATRDDAIISKGASTLAAVRNAIATERQKRILRGDFTEITDLSNGASGKIFSQFNDDKNGKANPVLEYPLDEGEGNGEWSKDDNIYTFHYFGGQSCDFNLSNNKLDGECEVFGN